ncbi:MAG TPA: hypothetical protein PLG22_07285 [Kiritimatiellia bacterium]|nr:hypothetical protein [Kiritimatiellia bacterium]
MKTMRAMAAAGAAAAGAALAGYCIYRACLGWTGFGRFMEIAAGVAAGALCAAILLVLAAAPFLPDAGNNLDARDRGPEDGNGGP